MPSNYNVDSSSESDDETYPNLTFNTNNIRPYDFDPLASTNRPVVFTTKRRCRSLTAFEERTYELVHLWKCKIMDTKESMCCRETGESARRIFC